MTSFAGPGDHERADHDLTGALAERSLEARGSLALKVIAALNVPGLLISPWAAPPSSLLAATSFVTAAAMSVLYLLVARAVDRRRGWAIAALRPLLVAITAFGVYAVIVAHGEGWIRVPIDAGLAIWAWFGRPHVRPAPRPGLRSAGVVLAAVLVLATAWYGRQVFGWGGLLDVQRPDLRSQVTADCGPAGTLPPAAITVTYDWSWARSMPFPSGLDVIVIGWAGVDRNGHPLDYLGDTPTSGPGIQPGLQDVPSLDLATEVESETPASWHWGASLASQELAPGRIQFQLTRSSQAPPQAGSTLTITATYIHEGIWRQDAAAFTCTW